MVRQEDLVHHNRELSGKNKALLKKLREGSLSGQEETEIDSFVSVTMNFVESETEQYNFNLVSLGVSAIFFSLFGLAEYFAATISNSLCLFADALNCLVDALTYTTSLILEDFKVRNRGVKLSYYTLWYDYNIALGAGHHSRMHDDLMPYTFYS